MTSLGAITLWISAHIRRDWRSLVMISVAVALAGGFAMTAGIGARRAASAWDEFLGRTLSPDVVIQVPVSQATATVDELRATRGVTSAAAMSFIGVMPDSYVPKTPADRTGGFVGLSTGFGTDTYRPIIIDGRAADPTKVDEFTINRAMAEATHLRPGDHVVLVSDPPAVRQPATVAGIHVGSVDTGLNSGSSLALLTPAFGARWFEPYVEAFGPQGQSDYSVVVMARVSDSSTKALLLGAGYSAGAEFSGFELVPGLDAVSNADTVLALVAAIGFVVAIGQVIARRVRHQAEQTDTLAALGLAPLARRVTLAGSNVMAATVGVLAAPIVTYVASPLTGSGLIEDLDPHGNHVVDVVVMVGGCAAAAAFFVAVAVGAAWRAETSAARREHSGGVSRVSLPGPAGLFGARVAAGWAGRSRRAVAIGNVAMLSAGIASVVAVVMWSGAARHLVATPASYGATWDAAVEVAETQNEDIDLFQQLDVARSRIEGRPGIASVLGRGGAGMVDTLSGGVELLEIDKTSGAWWPPLLAGREPRDAHEITVGAGLLDADHRLGDQVTLDGTQFTIVGEHVVTTISNGEFGVTAAVRLGAIPLTGLEFPTAVMWVHLGEGATIEQLTETVGEGFVVHAARSARPGIVTSLEGIGGLDELLLGVCSVLAFAALANGVILATNARRRDHATLRALGVNRSGIAASVYWHTAVVTLLASCVGIPLGLLAGSAVWRRTAEGIGVDAVLRRPGLGALPVLVGVTVAGTLVALATGASAVRRSRQLLSIE